MIKRSLLMLASLSLSISVHSQNGDTIYLWPEAVPGEIEAKHAPVTKPDRGDQVVRLTDVTDPFMTVHESVQTKTNGAGIIVCPGGGYNILAIDKEGHEIAEWLTSLGYTAFVLHYRVPRKQAGALMDIQRAIRVVRSKVDLWKLDIDKIGVLGFSAGGSLSARTSTRFNIETYPKVDDADSLSSRPDFALLIYSAYLDQGEDRKLTPELTIQQDTPPMFIFATADDKHANGSLVIAGALRDSGIPVELHLLATGGHGYGIRKGNVAAETWPGLAEKWLETTVLAGD